MLKKHNNFSFIENIPWLIMGKDQLVIANYVLVVRCAWNFVRDIALLNSRAVT